MYSIKGLFNISPNKVALNFFIFITMLLFGCGGGGGSGGVTKSGLNIPIVTVSGIAFDGLISGGTVSIYDFTNGTKGNQLATTTTDGKGLYNLSIQTESSPVLIEVTGGNYIEEASSTQVALQSTHKLTALTYYTMGTPINAAVTTYTHIAAGLAAYHIKQGTAVTTAINEANKSLSNLTGFDIVATIPRQITDASNANAVLTPELKYGFLAGAISMWTKNHVPTNGSVHISPSASIDFAQLMYQDITSDGFLDGKGLDNQGKAMQLLFGSTPLNADIYRKQLGISLVQMSNQANNKTGITPTIVLPFAQTYSGSSDPVFKGIAAAPINATPVVTITSHTSNQWVARTINFSVTIEDEIGLGITANELIVDTVSDSIINGNNKLPALSLNTTKYADGIRTITIKSANLLGKFNTATVALNFDNTAPTSTWTTGPAVFDQNGGGGWPSSLTGCASDSGIGLKSVQNLSNGTLATIGSNNCWSVSYNEAALTTPFYKIKISDALNNCSIYDAMLGVLDFNMPNPNQRGSSFTLISTGPC